MPTIEELQAQIDDLKTKLAAAGTPVPPEEPDTIASTSPAPVVAAPIFGSTGAPIEFKRTSELSADEKKQIDDQAKEQKIHAQAQSISPVVSAVESLQAQKDAIAASAADVAATTPDSTTPAATTSSTTTTAPKTTTTTAPKPA